LASRDPDNFENRRRYQTLELYAVRESSKVSTDMPNPVSGVVLKLSPYPALEPCAARESSRVNADMPNPISGVVLKLSPHPTLEPCAARASSKVSAESDKRSSIEAVAVLDARVMCS